MNLREISPLVTSYQSIKENYSHKRINWVTKTKNQMIFKFTHLLLMLVEFSQILSYVTKSMHPLHINTISSIFSSYLS